MDKLHELNKLEEYLREKKYNFARIDIFTPAELLKDLGREVGSRHQIIVFDGPECLEQNVQLLEKTKWLFDVICQYGSYGYEEGLLEIQGEYPLCWEDDNIEGHLTADDIIERLEKMNHDDSVRR